MSSQPPPKEYIVRVPKNSKKKYHMMRFHNANGVNFKNWNGAKMERENNYKEFKSLDDDQPKFGAGSEFGREQRDEARRKRYGINIKKYKPDDQPWLLSVKDKSSSTSIDKKFKGIREGGVSDNVAWYVFLQAKDGAFEAYPVEEWYNFQPINRYKALNAEEAEKEFERRDKIMNYFSVMYQKKLRNEDDDADAEDGGKKKAASKAFQLSEMDDWMSDKDSDDDGEDDADMGEERKPKKKPGKASRRKRGKQGGKNRKRDDGESGTDCEEESDEYDEGAEHEYVSEDSSDPEHEDDEKVTKDLAGVEEDSALKKLLNSDDEDEENNEDKKDEKKDENEQSDEDKKKKKRDSSSDLSDSSDEEKPKSKDGKKESSQRNADILKRKLAENPDGLLPANKKQRSDGPAVPAAPVLPSDSGMFEDQIRRYLVRKPMTTTEILQKLKSKKTGHGSEQLVDIIAVMLKKINPQKQRVKGKMYLSLKSMNG